MLPERAAPRPREEPAPPAPEALAAANPRRLIYVVVGSVFALTVLLHSGVLNSFSASSASPPLVGASFDAGVPVAAPLPPPLLGMENDMAGPLPSVTTAPLLPADDDAAMPPAMPIDDVDGAADPTPRARPPPLLRMPAVDPTMYPPWPSTQQQQQQQQPPPPPSSSSSLPPSTGAALSGDPDDDLRIFAAAGRPGEPGPWSMPAYRLDDMPPLATAEGGDAGAALMDAGARDDAAAIRDALPPGFGDGVLDRPLPPRIVDAVDADDGDALAGEADAERRRELGLAPPSRGVDDVDGAVEADVVAGDDEGGPWLLGLAAADADAGGDAGGDGDDEWVVPAYYDRPHRRRAADEADGAARGAAVEAAVDDAPPLPPLDGYPLGAADARAAAAAAGAAAADDDYDAGEVVVPLRTRRDERAGRADAAATVVIVEANHSPDDDADAGEGEGEEEEEEEEEGPLAGNAVADAAQLGAAVADALSQLRSEAEDAETIDLSNDVVLDEEEEEEEEAAAAAASADSDEEEEDEDEGADAEDAETIDLSNDVVLDEEEEEEEEAAAAASADSDEEEEDEDEGADAEDEDDDPAARAAREKDAEAAA